MVRWPHPTRKALFPPAIIALLALAFALIPASARADEGWVITSFEAGYTINEDGTVSAIEDIRVDFGALFGAALIGIPVIVAGVLLFILALAMPRRSADGRVMYRRCLGFRRYIETAETARQEFAEKANLFQEYLPYAIVFRCVDKWAKAFEGMDDRATQPGWYYGRHSFAAAAFASSVNDFSESISSVMASTPGGSGGSGFGGGGFSGGGGGGGGGGSW